MVASFPLGGCVDEVDSNWRNYHGYKDDVYLLQCYTKTAIHFMNHENFIKLSKPVLTYAFV